MSDATNKNGKRQPEQPSTPKTGTEQSSTLGNWASRDELKALLSKWLGHPPTEQEINLAEEQAKDWA